MNVENFMPHGTCYLWQPGALGLHVVSDALITLAYFCISFTLAYFVHKRKAATAMASVATAILLVKLVPQAMQLPSPSALRVSNAELQREIAERKRAESDIRRLNAELEQRVDRARYQQLPVAGGPVLAAAPGAARAFEP